MTASLPRVLFRGLYDREFLNNFPKALYRT
jgi:hypothetical protein